MYVTKKSVVTYYVCRLMPPPPRRAGGERAETGLHAGLSSYIFYEIMCVCLKNGGHTSKIAKIKTLRKMTKH